MPEVAEAKETPSMADSIRAAMTEVSSAPTETEAPAEAAGPAAEPEATAETTAEQPRGPDGKFAPKSVKDDLQKQFSGKPQAPLKVEAPQHWPEEDKQFFASLPDDNARQRWLEKNKSLENGYKTKFEEIAAWKKAVEPYTEYLQGLGATPQQAMQYLLNTERILRYGTPEQKAQAMQTLINDYQIPLPSNQSAPAQPPATQQTEGEHWDPVVNALRQELGQLKNVLTSRQQQEQQAEQQRVIASIVEFQNAKTEAGQPSNPYFAEVADDIATLALAERQAGRKPDLKNLYDKACWANETVRMKVLADRDAQAEQKRQADAKARATQARSAGSSVSGAPVGGAASDMPARSVLEEVTRQYRKGGGRV